MRKLLVRALKKCHLDLLIKDALGLPLAVTKKIVRYLAAYSLSRRLLNLGYHLLSFRGKRRFHSRFAKIFREEGIRLNRGAWIVFFAGREIRLPLEPGSAWRDWDSAVSILGHDEEIKETYACLVQSTREPSVFFDIGANYGTHSLLFLVHGWRVVSFEPNPKCHDYFRNACRLNHVTCEIESVALGHSQGVTELAFPERETWLGTTDLATLEKLDGRTLNRIEVKRQTLDSYVHKFGVSPRLIKIDVEGAEVSVLQGARETLQKAKPLVIFESWKVEHRARLWDLFDDAGYRICRLPFHPMEKPGSMHEPDFVASDMRNFIAIPWG